MGRNGKGAGPGHRIAHPGREDGTDSAPVSLPTVGEVQGNWKHGRRRKLLLLGPEIADATSLVSYKFRHLALLRCRFTASSEKRSARCGRRPITTTRTDGPSPYKSLGSVGLNPAGT